MLKYEKYYYGKYYKEYLDRFENMELVVTSALLGIRESQRIIADYVMLLNDFLNQATFDDEIGKYSYTVDIYAFDASKESFAKFEKENIVDTAIRKAKATKSPMES